jgi:hypothetical protein
MPDAQICGKWYNRSTLADPATNKKRYRECNNKDDTVPIKPIELRPITGTTILDNENEAAWEPKIKEHFAIRTIK